MLVLKTRYQKLPHLAFAPNSIGLAASGQYGVYWWPSVFEDPKGVALDHEMSSGVGFTPDGLHLITLLADVGLCAVNLADHTRNAASLPATRLGGIVIQPAATVCAATGLTVVESLLSLEVSGWQVGSNGIPNRVWTVEATPPGHAPSVAFAADGSWFIRPERNRDSMEWHGLFLHDSRMGQILRSVEGCANGTCGPLSLSRWRLRRVRTYE